MVYAAALGSALLLAVGFVLQQSAAEQEPLALSLRLSLLVDLARRPVWLAGIAFMLVGDLLSAVAFNNGDVALVEPLAASSLLFALPMAAARHRRHLDRRDWTGAVLLVGGLSLFVAVGDPHGGSTTHVAAFTWVVAGAAVAGAALILVAVSRGRRVALQAALLGGGAGVLYGLEDTLTQPLVHHITAGVLQAVTAWPLYVVAVCMIAGLLLQQSAFDMAPLAASLPALTVSEPIVGILLGLTVYREQIDLSAVGLGVAVVGLAAIVAGGWLLGRSKLVTGEVCRESVPTG